jgi:hypothetical protein
VNTKFHRVILGLATAICFSAAASAGPWAETGDASLRSDILVLASAGVIDNVTMQWPLPWEGILRRLSQAGTLDDQPDYVRSAAARVLARGSGDTDIGHSRFAVTVDGASEPALVRGFDAMGQSVLQGQGSVESMWGSGTAIHLAAGARTVFGSDRQVLMLDNSYVMQRVGPVDIYAGYKTHWWGPGWFSAMSLSTNARPMPQFGISRADTDAFETPLLSWLGPWQMEFFVGLMDGPRVAENTVYTGFRFAFSPLPHLEIGLARTTELCGSGHSCSPLTDYFSISNDNTHVNQTNDQGNIDIRYSGAFASLAYEIYVQLMNEDTNPLQHSATSHLGGASLWMPVLGGTERLTVEYTDSVATYDLWGSGTMSGSAYNNGGYPDGMRYRGRSLGFSLDSDSRLFSVQADYLDNSGRDYALTYHHAEISSGRNTLGNAVTSAPVIINLLEARVGFPLHVADKAIRFDVAGRLQDDRPRPDTGKLASVEASLTVNF